MTVDELKTLISKLPGDIEVKALVGPEEDFDSYQPAYATLAGDLTTGDRYLLIGQDWGIE